MGPTRSHLAEGDLSQPRRVRAGGYRDLRAGSVREAREVAAGGVALETTKRPPSREAERARCGIEKEPLRFVGAVASSSVCRGSGRWLRTARPLQVPPLLRFPPSPGGHAASRRILPLFQPAGMGLPPAPDQGEPRMGAVYSVPFALSGSRGCQPYDRRRLSWAPPGRVTGRRSPGWNDAPLLDPDRGMPGTV